MSYTEAIEQLQLVREAQVYNLQHLETDAPEIKITVSLPPYTYLPSFKGDFARLASSDFSIGLVRTEQALQHALQPEVIAAYLLNPTHETLEPLSDMFRRISDCRDKKPSVLSHLRDTNDKRVRVRLLDLLPREILTEEQGLQFFQQYGTLDLRGGAALTAFPSLYSSQLMALLSAKDDDRSRGFEQRGHLEILAPAIRMGDDAKNFEKIIWDLSEPYERVRFGCMLETVEACKNIEDIAPHCSFLSIGSNDLTEEVTGLLRGNFNARAAYKQEHGLDPFETLAPEVEALLRTAVAQAKDANPLIKIDVCGAHAANPTEAFKLYQMGVRGFSVPPSYPNLAALPVLLNEKIRKAAQSALINEVSTSGMA